MTSKPSSEREWRIAKVLRPLGNGPMTRAQATVAAGLLGVHPVTVYRLRRRFLKDPVASSLADRRSGPSPGSRLLDDRVEEIVDEVLTRWLPRRQLAHPLKDLTREIRRRCARAGVKPVSRATVARRWKALRERQALELANDPEASVAPGHLRAERPLEIVQIDHTLADVFVVDEVTRKPIGRPWLSISIDIATRTVVGVFVAMERPSAATVALLLTRIALAKSPWLKAIGVPEVAWPMSGLPETLHLDNAAEFRSAALRSGCREYGIELMYRPVRRPHFGGHVERLNRTLMERLRGLPGATTTISERRKGKTPPPEKTAKLSLREFERWLVLEIANTYHHSEHRGLMGATPAGAWDALTKIHAHRVLPADVSHQLRFLVSFLPMARRTIQGNGLTLFYLRYWHPIFMAWREMGGQVSVRYHPEDLSRVFVSRNGKDYVEATFADLRRPRISLWEQRQARRELKAAGSPDVSEALIFRTIEMQKKIVARARGAGRRPATSASESWQPAAPSWPRVAPTVEAIPPAVNYDKVPEDSNVEIWSAGPFGSPRPGDPSVRGDG